MLYYLLIEDPLNPSHHHHCIHVHMRAQNVHIYSHTESG